MRASLALIVLAPLTAVADLADVPAGSYSADPQHAYILFSYSHLGLSNPTVGFNSFTTELDLDTENPTQSSITVSIDASSIDSRVPKFNDHLMSDDFFAVADHPEISFASTAISGSEEDGFEVTGDLTIKGMTKQVTLDATINAAKTHPLKNVPAVGISATTTVLRSDFGLGAYAPAVSDEVEIRIDIEYLKQ